MKSKIKEDFSVYSKAKIRLNRLIAEAGITSRRKADELIQSGAVKVNGRVVTKLGTVVSWDDFVTVNGKPVKLLQKCDYVLLNKPKDTICSLKDEKGRKTVIDLISIKKRIYPVGRLDRNTTGVLLLTNDGELAHRLMHPRYRILRIYNVELNKPLLPEHAQSISKGVEVDGEKFQKCEILIDYKNPHKLSIALAEGKNREVRNMFEHFGYEVKKLHRKMFANLTTRGLRRGEWRYLTKSEIHMLKKLVGLI